MSAPVPRISYLSLGLVLAASSAGGAPLAAQEPVRLAGVVADEATWTPIASATVVLVESGLETKSAANGTFAFADAPVGPATVRVDAPGFATMVQEVTVTEDGVVFVQFILPSMSAFLEEILVVGRAEKGAPLSETKTAADLLAGQLPGVGSGTGMVGRNLMSVQLRGVSSFTAQKEPDVFLNGVRVGGSFEDALGTLQKIPASDVKEIRLARGPASAVQQGSADGAIYITTKSGADR